MSGKRKDGRRDWFLVSDAATSLLRTALKEADAQGALAILAEVHRGFDFRPVLAAGTGNVTCRELTMIRDCQYWREERDPKARTDIDVEAAPEAQALDARDTGATPPAKAPQTAPARPPKPPAPPVPPPVAPEALAKAAQRSAGTPPDAPQIAAAVDEAVSDIAKAKQLSDEQMKSMTVAEYHKHFRDTAQKLPAALHNVIVRWMMKNRDVAEATTVLDALKGGCA